MKKQPISAAIPNLEIEAEKLASIVKFSKELINLGTLDGQMVFLNDAGGKMLGIDPGHLEDHGIMEVIPDHYTDLVTTELLPSLVSSGTWEGELQYKNLKTGDLCDVHAMCFTIKDPKTGEPLYLANVSLDITARKQAERDLQQYREHLEELVEERTVLLKQSEARFRGVFEHSPVGIVLADADSSRILEANATLGSMLGYEAEELLGLRADEIIHPGDLPDGHDLHEALRGEIPESIAERRLVKRDGSAIWISMAGSVIRDGAGKPEYALAVVEDITGRKQAEQERERLTAELVRKNRELEQVLYVASHDLRAPLVNVQGFAKELALSLDEAEAAFKGDGIPQAVRAKIGPILEDAVPEALGYISKSIAKMDSLLGGLLDLSRISRVEMNLEELQMKELIGDVVTVVEYQLKESGVSVEIGELPGCRGDAKQIHQVFSNLIGNALKYLDPQREGKIRLSGEQNGDQSVYLVTDNGIGVRQEHQLKIFELFHQLDPQQKGEGVGLAIVSRIVERHGGKVWLESEPGQGSSFYVSLPAGTNHL